MRELQAQLNRIEAMLLQLLAAQPLPMLQASEDEIFDRGIDQGLSLEEITRQINEMKEANNGR